MSRISCQLGRLLGGIGACVLFAGLQAVAHTIDVIELPNEGGTQVLTDGTVLNTFPGAESAIVGANFNDGNYTPQLINVNLYEDAAETIVSDTVTITVPAANPPQITVGFNSEIGEVPLPRLSPENIALIETGGLQSLVTLTNSNGIQTTVRVQSDVPEPVVPVVPAPEPSSLFLLGAGMLGFVALKRRGSGTPLRG